MTNYMTRPGGKEISNELPLQVDDVTQASDRVNMDAETFTFTCAAAAGSSGKVSSDKAPMLNLSGDRVGSYWGEQKNLAYTLNSTDFIGALTETAGSADITITDLENNLELLFETPTATCRYVLKAIDAGGNVLYGWIKGVAASGDAYTFDIFSEPAASNQDWVGTLGGFDNADVARVEIYSNESSFVWVTGTVLTKEVPYDEEKSEYEFLKGLSNGEFGINYRAGVILYKKATTGTSDTATYSTVATATAIIDAGGGQIVEFGGADVDDSAFAIGTDKGTVVMGLYNSAEDTVDDSDKGALAMTAKRHLMVQDDAYDSSTQSNKGAEVSPLSSHYAGETLIDESPIPQSTTDYGYFDMAGYKYFTLQGGTLGAAPTDVLTVTIEATTQDDGTPAASCAYQDVTNALFGVASWVDTNFMAIADTVAPFKYVRVKYVTSAGGGNDCALTVYLKKLY